MNHALTLEPLVIDDYVEVLAPDQIRVRGTRIGLEHIIERFRDGYTPEQIVEDFPHLSLEIVYALIAHYLHDPEPIESYLAAVQTRVTRAKQDWAKERSVASLRIEALAQQRGLRKQ